MAELNPFRALRRTAQTGGSFSAALSQLSPGAEAAGLLREWLEKGAFKQDTAAGFMIYEQEYIHLGQKKKVKGFLCLVKVEEEQVIPHKGTVPSEVQELLTQLQETSCQFNPISCLYEDDGRKTMSRVNLLSSGKPRFTFSEGGVTHRLWSVNDTLVINEIREDFAARRLYLADGHSCWAAAKEWKKRGGSDSALLFLTDLEQDVTVLPSHCLLHGPDEFDKIKFLTDCEPYFQVIKRGTTDEIAPNLDALYRQGKKAFAFYSGGADWTLLILKEPAVMDKFFPGKSDAFRGLDSTVLHSLILEHILGIDSRSAGGKSTFTFSPFLSCAISSVQTGDVQCAFLLNPARKKEIIEVSESGEKMQPNTTRIYPTLPVGTVMVVFNEQLKAMNNKQFWGQIEDLRI